MNQQEKVDTTPGGTNPESTYTIYSAGGLFTQDELTTNILLKEAIWRLSEGKFQLFLPQSKELQMLDRPDIQAYIRNSDLLEVVKADIVMARFDGVELDSGTVVEYVMAKVLGKPTVILRSDFRRLSGTGLSEPYNLMVKNWPRSIEIHLDAYMLWAGIFAEEHQAAAENGPFQTTMKAELSTVERSVDKIAEKVIAGMEAVIQMDSPYPPDYQELVYQAARFTPGRGFDQMLTAAEVEEIIQRLRRNGTL
jgi:nucleoside 2-deoxyribosyltransferase